MSGNTSQQSKARRLGSGIVAAHQYYIESPPLEIPPDESGPAYIRWRKRAMIEGPEGEKGNFWTSTRGVTWRDETVAEKQFRVFHFAGPNGQWWDDWGPGA